METRGLTFLQLLADDLGQRAGATSDATGELRGGVADERTHQVHEIAGLAQGIVCAGPDRAIGPSRLLAGRLAIELGQGGDQRPFGRFVSPLPHIDLRTLQTLSKRVQPRAGAS